MSAQANVRSTRVFYALLVIYTLYAGRLRHAGQNLANSENFPALAERPLCPGRLLACPFCQAENASGYCRCSDFFALFFTITLEITWYSCYNPLLPLVSTRPFSFSLRMVET